MVTKLKLLHYSFKWLLVVNSFTFSVNQSIKALHILRATSTKSSTSKNGRKRQENRMPAEEEELNKLPELTPMEEVKLRELYNKIDKNRDGKIDIKDLSTALSEMEVAQLPGHAQVPITFIYSWLTQKTQHFKYFFFEILFNCDAHT